MIRDRSGGVFIRDPHEVFNIRPRFIDQCSEIVTVDKYGEEGHVEGIPVAFRDLMESAALEMLFDIAAYERTDTDTISSVLGDRYLGSIN